MPEAVIVDAIRTPIGRAARGSLRSVRVDDLAAIPLRALIERNPGLEHRSIGDVMMGCGYGEGEGEQGDNVGRLALLLAGIDHHVPGTTVKRFCAFLRSSRDDRSSPPSSTSRTRAIGRRVPLNASVRPLGIVAE